MMYIERKYINMVSSQLRNFHWKTEKLANCSCPQCGDSSKNKLRTRFFFIQDNGTYHVYCHNCHYSRSFLNFLADFNMNLHDDMRTELVKEKLTGITRGKIEKISPERPVFGIDHVKRLTKITKLGTNHPASRYIASRKIPEDKHKLIYYTDNYGGWVNTYLPDKLKDQGTEPRIVFPLYDHRGSFFGATGRSLDPNIESHKRYITVITDDRQSKVYGQDKVDTSKTFFACEGILDSFFLNNSVAMLGSSLSKCNLDLTNAVFIFDNEPRNKDIIREMEKVATVGLSVFIWPENISHKDINDCVLGGINNMEEIILANTHRGLSLELEIKQWRKC